MPLDRKFQDAVSVGQRETMREEKTQVAYSEDVTLNKKSTQNVKFLHF